MEPLDELDEVEVTGVDRTPGVVKRAKRAPGLLASGTVLPRLQGILNPALYRERGDTSRMVESVFGEEGALARLAASNPDLATEIRQQADTPMSVGEHKKFRSGLLALVGDEVAKEQRTQYQLRDNAGFMEAFSAMDAALPGVKDPDRFTFEEAERRQIAIMYQQAQELALLDPDGSKALMADVRKKADSLTANVRTQMEQIRKAARIEDSALFNAARERISETDDVVASLRNDMDDKGVFRKPNEAIIGRALAALGRANSLPSSGINEAATAAGAQVNAAAGGGTKGLILDTAIGIGGMVANKIKEGDDVAQLIERLEFNKGLIQKSYTEDRARLEQRYKPIGIAFGAEPGEVYAVLDENYKRAADQFPAKGAEPKDKPEALRNMLTDEQEAAQAALEDVKPEASANMPGARERLAAAIERLNLANDDLAIFDADQAEATGKPLPVAGDDAGAEVVKARQRRQARSETRAQGQVRKGIMEALRGYTR